MRPLKLQVQGFTSFRDRQELDFSGLDVFAITGPTGSGKSSLLDAMTYALYGKVERVGNECSELVTHGMNRMSVTLEFEVDQMQFRITRSTPASGGGSKVLLEKLVDGSSQSYGEGADRITECNRHITALLGLDYTGFTRSVLLPQGKFAEFMSGEAKQRRDILSDLLGLGLFKRIAQRAGQLASSAENAAQVRHDLVTTQFADVTRQAVERAHAATQELAARLQLHERVAHQVAEISERWRADQSRLHNLQACAIDVREWIGRLQQAVGAVAQLIGEFESHAASVERADALAVETGQLADTARAGRASAEANWGTPLELAGVQATALRLPQLAGTIAARRAELKELVASSPQQAAEVAAIESAVTEAGAACATRDAELQEAQQHQRELEHADKAAALAAGLTLGDPCPVCGQPLASLPEQPGAAAIEAAAAQVKAAQQAVKRAQTAEVKLQQQLTEKRRDVEEARKDQVRRTEEIDRLQREHAEAREQVVRVLRGAETEDPVALLDERIRELTELAGRESQAERRAGEAAGALTNLQRTGELLLQRLGQQREQLEGPAPVVVARATALLPETGFQLPAPALEADADAATVLTFGRARVTVVCDLASALEASAASLADAEQKLLQQAHAVVGDLDGLEPAVSLAALVDSLGAARLQVTAEHVKAAQRAEMLVTRLAEREKLEREVDEQRGHAATYSDLAYDLRQDKLVAFLQDQALQILAAAGTRHLQALSGERYELRFTKHAFSVVDRWNADEERNVRTLSGGETFLASLALALALSEQVRSLSVTERARLDSLFLDEGFGTLDSESLRTVQDALDHLSGDGRLVGVITHVRELAENLPRIEVEKSPRGSRLKPIAQ